MGLQAYRGGYPARLREALADTFEAVARVTGDEAFTALAARYVRAHPPSSYNLNDAGASLASYLRDDPLTLDLAFLPDLAELEWKIAAAFHAPWLPPLDLTALAGWVEDDWACARLRLQPSVGVVRSSWPLQTLWQSRPASRAELDVALAARAENVVVYRHDLIVRLELVTGPEATALTAVLGGGALMDVLAAAAANGAADAEIASWFAHWQALGIIAGCHRDDGRPQ